MRSREASRTEPGLTGCEGAAPLVRRASRPLSKPRRPGGSAPPDSSSSSHGRTPRSALSQRQPPTPSAQRPTCRAAPGQLAPRSDGMGPRSHTCCLLWTQCLLRLSQKPQLPEPPPASRQPLSTWNRQARPVTLPTGASHLGGSHGGWPLASPCAHLLSPGTGTVPCWPVLGAGLVLVLSPGYVQEGPGAS